MSADAEFAGLAREYLDNRVERHPDVATDLGDHRFDYRLPDPSAQTLDDERRALDGWAGRGFQEEGEAAGKWRRAQLTSAQLSTYYVGYSEISDLAADLRAAGPGLTDQQVHDRMLAHGSPPARLLRTLITS